MRKLLRFSVVMAAVVAAHLMGVSMARVMAAPTPERLEEQARELQAKTDKGSWHKAAALYQRAAELRPAGDPVAVKHLMLAANLLFHVDRPTQAMQVMEAAGDRALAAGDVIAAAQAYAGVAWVASHEGETKIAKRFADKVELLAGSPLLDAASRESIAKLVAIAE